MHAYSLAFSDWKNKEKIPSIFKMRKWSITVKLALAGTFIPQWPFAVFFKWAAPLPPVLVLPTLCLFKESVQTDSSTCAGSSQTNTSWSSQLQVLLKSQGAETWNALSWTRDMFISFFSFLSSHAYRRGKTRWLSFICGIRSGIIWSLHKSCSNLTVWAVNFYNSFNCAV